MSSVQFIFRFLLCLLGILLALPLLVLITMAFQLPITSSGIGYLLGGVLLIVGLTLAPLTSKNSLILIINGLVVMVIIAAVRLVLAQQSHMHSVKMIALPSGDSARWISYL